MRQAVAVWIDNHCHLPADDPDLAAQLVGQGIAAGVTRMINVGCDLESSVAALESARRFESVWATVGVHPHEAKGGIEGIATLAQNERVVAIGECGLDFHYNHSDAVDQRSVFAAQIAMAHELDLALVIHTREAWAETFSIIDSEGIPPRTVFHCFTGGPADAEQCLSRGAALSFSGIVTFPSAQDVRDAASICPLDRLMVETDAPYLAPVPHRGRPNRPELVAVVGAAIAELRGEPVETIAAAAWSTASALYRLPGSEQASNVDEASGQDPVAGTSE